MTKGDTTMFSLQKHFLIRRLSKYLKQNLPAVKDTLESRSYLDMLKLNDDSYDEDFFDDDDFRDEDAYSGHLPAKTAFDRFIRSGSTAAPQSRMDTIQAFVDSNYSKLSFSQRLNKYLSERDITTAMIYKRSFIDRKLISKITSSSDYHPSKQTVFALCIALRLNLDESTEFLALAGYTFNRHKKYDLIIKFLLNDQIYDIDMINEILFRFHEPCFGE